MAKRSSRDGLLTAFDGLREVTPRRLRRLAVWAGIAGVAIATAGVAGYTGTGPERSAPPRSMHAETMRPPIASRPEPASADTDVDIRRLSEAVRMLAADRDRLLARVSMLEHNLDDVTGSIPPRGTTESSVPAPTNPTPQIPAKLPPTVDTAPAPAINAPTPVATAPAPAPSAPGPGRQGSSAPAPSAAPATPSSGAAGRVADGFAATADTGPTGSVATRTEFGIDLGTAPTIDALRSLWTGIKIGRETLFDGLRPVIAIREGSKPGAVELRLVAGPLGNVGAAARLCAVLNTAGLTCQPALFDGQRLALK